LPHEAIARLSEIKTAEWNVMQGYVHHDDCLMQFLAGQLDDPHAAPCGKCANCDPTNAVPEIFSHETGVAAAEFLENIFIEIEPRKQVDTSNFPIYRFPYKLASQNLLHETGRVLCHWGEAGWGEIAKAGKEAGSFDPKLANAAAKMIRQRWNPDPFPTCVTYVPSNRNPQLVADFAQRLATALVLPCVELVKKVNKNKQQKFMQNSQFRSSNLDGVFEVLPVAEGAPVLLVDDAVDSGWTFAVISALLKRAGSGPVYPFAIMSTTTSD
jgi:ATP-dependent DNA helicase RecQ